MPTNYYRTRSPLRAAIAALSFFFAAMSFCTQLRAQDFSQAIRAEAKTIMEATLEGDYEKVMEYTYPQLVEMMDKVAGGTGKGAALVKAQMEKLKSEGTQMDSGFVGTPTSAVPAGTELIAIVPTLIYMTTPKWHLKQESYMIAVSADSGKSWTFVNGSNNTEELLPTLFPNWNKELVLPTKKGPEVSRREIRE